MKHFLHIHYIHVRTGFYIQFRKTNCNRLLYQTIVISLWGHTHTKKKKLKRVLLYGCSVDKTGYFQKSFTITQNGKMKLDVDILAPFNLDYNQRRINDEQSVESSSILYIPYRQHSYFKLGKPTECCVFNHSVFFRHCETLGSDFCGVFGLCFSF